MVKKILDTFPELQPKDVQNRAMGSQGTDVMLSPLAEKILGIAIECKNQQSLNFWSAFEQAKANCEGLQPVLVAKRNRTQPLAVVDLDFFLTLLQKSSTITANEPKGS